MRITLLAMLLACTPHLLSAQVQQKGTWTSPDDETIPALFHVQGEYVGEVDGGQKLGAQVIALDEEDAVQAVVYPGGLPGAGWDETNKILLDGALADGKIELAAAEGDKKYIDGNPQRFSATKEFPPQGHKPWTGAIREGILRGKTDEGKSFVLKRTERKSDTLGISAKQWLQARNVRLPDQEDRADDEGAFTEENIVVLFDGENGDHFDGGRVADGVLHTDAKDVRSRDKFKYYTMHLEFRTPFRPKARGQGRGNSGFYQTNGQEVQVLDSFGLDGLKNECGALYGRAGPRINMCLPPLAWQTYDVELLPASDSEKKNQATLTVRHNGVVIHDKVPCRPGGGNFKLQGHGNLLQYRNIWLVAHDESANNDAEN